MNTLNEQFYNILLNKEKPRLVRTTRKLKEAYGNNTGLNKQTKPDRPLERIRQLTKTKTSEANIQETIRHKNEIASQENI